MSAAPSASTNVVVVAPITDADGKVEELPCTDQ
jgi:hypothetical protein